MADAPYGLDSLNFDAMDPDDMRVIARELRRLAHYVDTKLVAMRQRAGGDINRALTSEAACDAIYTRIPENWRW